MLRLGSAALFGLGRWSLLGLPVAMHLLTSSAPAASPEPQAIYLERCAVCHGAEGQGTADGYDRPLGGNRSLEELTELIDQTMPQGEPERCTGDDARLLAGYLYEQYYATKGSAEPSSRLARLTVTEHRNAVADLLARFGKHSETTQHLWGPGDVRGESASDRAPPGLEGRYFQSAGMSKANKQIFQRIDHQLEFDFGEASPGEGITADQFAIIWDAGLFTDATGYHQFRLTTENGARVYLNLDPHGSLHKLRDDSGAAGQPPLIDAWVGSGEQRTESARVFLLGGRIYPLRVEFFKYLEPAASIRLEWKPPHGVWTTLDAQHVAAVQSGRVFALQTPFPADDRSFGYERGNSISPAWYAAATQAAIDTAAEVVDRLPYLAGVTKDGKDRLAHAQQFTTRLATAAFRRPLTPAEVETIAELTAEAENLKEGVYRAVLRILLSPDFLYVELPPPAGTPQDYVRAARLARALWDSLPDERLMQVAAEGGLATAEQVRAVAGQMLADRRARAKVRSFFRHWLEFDQRDLAKDKEAFPEFDEAIIADLRRSLELFLEEIVWSDRSDYRELLLADYLLLNPRLQALYAPTLIVDSRPDAGGDEVSREVGREAGRPSGGEFVRVPFPPDERSGVLTHPYLLSAHAYHNSTSPIHRGVFLTRHIVGRHLSPPPTAVAFDDQQFSPDWTMRQKITELTRDAACMACHSVINPLGFSLEHYDAVGRWREQDNGQPIDATGQYTSAGGARLSLTGARDIAEFAAASESARRAFVRETFRYMMKNDPATYDPAWLDELTRQFSENQCHVQKLWIEIAVRVALDDAPSAPNARGDLKTEASSPGE